MHDLLKALEALQDVDARIGELHRGRAEHPAKLAELEERLGAARQSAEEKRKKVADLEGHKKTLEEQLLADKEKVKKWEARLSEQRSPREYTALAREIDIAKKQNVTVSEEITELSKEIRAAREIQEASEGSFAELEAAIQKDIRTIRSSLAAIDEREGELQARRAEAAGVVSPQMLRRYDQIQKRRGVALAKIVAGACSGCRMQIPPQLYNQLLTQKRFDTCPSCGRLIYAPEPFQKEDEAIGSET